jgi:hypothetical protein
MRLLREGHRTVAEQQALAARSRREAVTCTSGVLTGVYGSNYLNDLRKDWPT